MRQATTIMLNHPFEHHGVMLREVKVKEPTGGDFLSIGKPRIPVHGKDGSFWVDQQHVIKRYVDRCLDHQDGEDLLRRMSLSDAMQVTETVLSFFEEAQATNWAKQSISSSSDAAS